MDTELQSSKRRRPWLIAASMVGSGVSTVLVIVIVAGVFYLRQVNDDINDLRHELSYLRIDARDEVYELTESVQARQNLNQVRVGELLEEVSKLKQDVRLINSDISRLKTHTGLDVSGREFRSFEQLLHELQKWTADQNNGPTEPSRKE